MKRMHVVLILLMGCGPSPHPEPTTNEPLGCLICVDETPTPTGTPTGTLFPTPTMYPTPTATTMLDGCGTPETVPSNGLEL